MPDSPETLTHQQSTQFYDALGAKQDWQAFFEVPSMRDLIAHADFETAHAVVEFGCGTGTFAEQILSRHLSPEATYLMRANSPGVIRPVRMLPR